MDFYNLATTDENSPEEMGFFEALTQYNDSQVGDSGFRQLTIFARDADGTVVGGLRGSTYLRWLYVGMLVVAEGHRRGGLGSRLLNAAEQEARDRGCIGVYLDTFSFQAWPFYEKHGYSLFGTLEEFPPGHRRYFLQKRLVP